MGLKSLASSVAFFVVNVAAKRPSSNLCSASAIQSFVPTLPGITVFAVQANPVYNGSTAGDDSPILPATNVSTADYCNVTVSYGHGNWADQIHLSIYLPLAGWNGQFVATGGGGWVTGPSLPEMMSAVSQGYAAAGTDGGHTGDDLSWAVERVGSLVNLPLLVDFASQSLGEMVTIGRPVAERFFATSTQYTYWAGCSTGGRQGLMMAQRYSHLFDGILANAPAINWPQFIVAEMWAQTVMHNTDTFPPACVLNTFTAAAVNECDGKDGLLDGVIDRPSLCEFDPESMVGQSLKCNDSTVVITQADALLAKEIRRGPHLANGTSIWFGLNPDSDLTQLAGTTCTDAATCTSSPFSISASYISLFLAKDPSIDPTKLSYQEFFDYFAQSVQEYEWIIGTNNPDLRHLRETKTKVITFHGLADPLIFPNGTVDYYKKVLAVDANAADYYRFFEAPGVGHCGGGLGPFPGNAFLALKDWVEEGKIPHQLDAVATYENGTTASRPLCPYPAISKYQGGNPRLASSYSCD